MKSLIGFLVITTFILSSCDLNDGLVRPDMPVLRDDMAHLNIYIELLPDPSLDPDAQCAMGHELRLRSREGFQISFYTVDGTREGETRIRFGTTNREGNYNAHDLDPATYRVMATDPSGETQEQVLSPVLGKITKLTFSFD